MSNADHHIAGPAAEARAPRPSGMRAGDGIGAATPDGVGAATPDTADAHHLNLARALQLGELLQMRVLVDESGWLRGDVEVAYQRESGNTIRPITVRVAMDACDEHVLADGGPVAVCLRYNAALAKLGQLARDFAAMGEARPLSSGAPLAKVRRELDRLDAMIAARQTEHMGHGVAQLQTLVRETAYLEGRHAQLAAIVQAAERSASVAWDGDTEDIAIDGGCGTRPPGDPDERL